MRTANRFFLPAWFAFGLSTMPAAWTTDVVATNAMQPEIRVRKTLVGGIERMYVVYRDLSNYNIAVAYPSGTSWTRETIESGVNGGAPHLTIDPSGVPHLAYRKGTQARHVSRVAAGTGNCGTNLSWRCETLPISGLTSDEIHIAADNFGGIHYAYTTAYWPSGSRLHHALQSPDGSWVSTMMANQETSTPTSLIAYGTSGVIGFGPNAAVARYAAPNWIVTFFPDTPTWAQGLVDVKVDSANVLHVCYVDPAKQVTYGQASSPTTAWYDVIGMATTEAGPPSRCSIVLRANGDPVVAYVANTSPPHVRVSKRIDFYWNDEDVATALPIPVSLAIRSNDKLVVASTNQFASSYYIQVTREQ